MEVTIVFDNTSTKEDLISDWGFACVIENENHRILFDTGGDGHILMHNLEKLHIDPRTIDIIFISHNHFDHVGGLSAFLNANTNVTAYLPPSFRGVRKAKNIVYVKDQPQKLTPDLFTTGELEGIEHALILPTSKGLMIFVGCSHPNMNNILERASHFGKVYGILGGLHGFNQYALFDSLRFICPTHCTQHLTEIKDHFPEKVFEGSVGKVFHF